MTSDNHGTAEEDPQPSAFRLIGRGCKQGLTTVSRSTKKAVTDNRFWLRGAAWGSLGAFTGVTSMLFIASRNMQEHQMDRLNRLTVDLKHAKDEGLDLFLVHITDPDYNVGTEMLFGDGADQEVDEVTINQLLSKEPRQ